MAVISEIISIHYLSFELFGDIRIGSPEAKLWHELPWLAKNYARVFPALQIRINLIFSTQSESRRLL